MVIPPNLFCNHNTNSRKRLSVMAVIFTWGVKKVLNKGVPIIVEPASGLLVVFLCKTLVDFIIIKEQSFFVDIYQGWGNAQGPKGRPGSDSQKTLVQTNVKSQVIRDKSDPKLEAKRIMRQSKIKTKKTKAKVHEGQADGKVQKPIKSPKTKEAWANKTESLGKLRVVQRLSQVSQMIGFTIISSRKVINVLRKTRLKHRT